MAVSEMAGGLEQRMPWRCPDPPPLVLQACPL